MKRLRDKPSLLIYNLFIIFVLDKSYYEPMMETNSPSITAHSAEKSLSPAMRNLMKYAKQGAVPLRGTPLSYSGLP